MRGYHKWALAHSPSCCIIHIGIIQFLYNNCLFDFYFGLCYSRVVFTLEQELLALPEYLSASLVILWVSCCLILSFRCSAMSTIIFLFVSFFLYFFLWLYYQSSSICDFWKYLLVVEWFKYGYSIMHPIQYYYFIQGIICLIEKMVLFIWVTKLTSSVPWLIRYSPSLYIEVIMQLWDKLISQIGHRSSMRIHSLWHFSGVYKVVLDMLYHILF